MSRTIVERKAAEASRKLRDLITRLNSNDNYLTKLDFRDNGVLGNLFHDSNNSRGASSGSSNDNENNGEDSRLLFSELLEAFRTNSSVTYVNVIMRFLRCLSEEEKFLFLDAITSLPNLRCLRVGSSGLSSVVLRALANALAPSPPASQPAMTATTKTTQTPQDAASEICSETERGVVRVDDSNANDNNNNCDNNDLDRSKSKHLTSLRLHSIHFCRKVTYHKCVRGNKDFEAFLKALKSSQLRSFTVDDAESTFDLNALVEALCHIKTLKDLYIKSFVHETNSIRLSTTSLLGLCHSSTLKSLTLKRLNVGPLLPQVSQALQENQVLEFLNLESNQLDQTCGKYIAKILEKNTKLVRIDLGYNLIPDEGGNDIANALLLNKSSRLSHLDLSANELGIHSCVALQSALRNCNLEYLNLSQNSLGDELSQTIAYGLLPSIHGNDGDSDNDNENGNEDKDKNIKSNGNESFLKSLTLSENLIGDSFCGAIATSLAKNHTLQRLNLSDNKIGDEGCTILATVLLSNNSTLESLSMFNNKIGTAGVLQLAKALRPKQQAEFSSSPSECSTTNSFTSALKHLNLAGNERVGKDAYMALVDMLEYNVMLERLWTCINPFQPMISFYLKLNQAGRRNIWLRGDKSDYYWLDALVTLRRDLSSVYYIIRTHPLPLCDATLG